jgi:aldose sugar dehydrogenase
MPRHRTTTLVLLALVLACRAEQVPAQGPQQKSPQPKPVEGVVRAETFASGLVHPWALAFMPDGRLLVTERPGRMRIVDKSGTHSEPLTGVPPVQAQGQGGLLDVAVAPDFARSRMVYWSFSEPGDEGGISGTSVARGKLNAAGTGFEDVKVIYQQKPKVRSGGHYGSRLVFARDGKLWITQGDRQQAQFRARVQDLSQGMGKIMRVNADGTVPKDNPFVGKGDAQPEIWSTGHRNVQAAALHPETGELWSIEHGPQGGDELNNPKAGKNYGWPVICYCVDYGGGRMGEGTTKEGLEQPVYYWDPVIAPSGMTFYTGDRYPGWKGSILVGGMVAMSLVRLELKDGKVVKEERYPMGERVRDVQQGPDGLVYIVTDSPNGRVIRVQPAR